jgi:NitT/TauT family transport system permease protein
MPTATDRTTTRGTTTPAELAGLDALELTVPRARSRASRIWAVVWPKLGAVALALLIWQVVVWSGWKPEYILPGPRAVFESLFSNLDVYQEAALVTLQRGVTGFAAALVLGTVVGALVARIRVLRAAFGSMITGLQTMPSIAWFPAALVLFGLHESAIFFVVVIGAFPSIANGFIAGVDNTSPILLRAARVLGARGWRSMRYVILPAALPTYVAGLKQGWAFAWRSLLAGELLVLIAGKPSLGRELDIFRQTSDYTGMYATMIVILFIGIVIDSLFFGVIDRRIRRRYGLIDAAAT